MVLLECNCGLTIFQALFMACNCVFSYDLLETKNERLIKTRWAKRKEMKK